MVRRNDPDFRREEVSQILNCWRHGLSCSVIGVGSAGKTNLLQHLLDKDVQAAYLGADGGSLVAVVIDANMLTPLPFISPHDAAHSEQFILADDRSLEHACWSGFELMLHRLIVSLYPLFTSFPRVDVDHIYEMYHAIQDGTNPTLYLKSIRFVEEALNTSVAHGLKIVFLLDEFDELIRLMPPVFLQSLRGLRDRFKGRVSYTTFTRAPVPTLIARHHAAASGEAFSELFTDHTLYLAGYQPRDAMAMLTTLNQRRTQPVSEAKMRFIVTLTGGFAGLTRAALQAASQIDESQDTEAQAQALALIPAIRAECLAIWRGLTTGEQQIVRATTRQSAYTIDADTEDAISQLIQKQLLRLLNKQGKAQLQIVPPLFHAFVQRQLYRDAA